MPGPAPGATAPASPQQAPGLIAPVQTPAQKASFDDMLEQTRGEITKYRAETDKTSEQIANAQAINDLLPRVNLGWGADTIQQGAKILSRMGVSDANIETFAHTNPAAGDELNKLFLKFSAGAVREMGAREPGSVIALFGRAFPNLETQPHAAEMMNNALMMQSKWYQDRANAAEQRDLQQRATMGQFGENYQGLHGFRDQFNQANDPHDYWRAAAAMSQEKDIAWKGLSPAEAQKVYQQIMPGRQFIGGDGKLYMKPSNG